MRTVRTTRTIHTRRRAESCALVTSQPTGCGLASTTNEGILHRAYFATFREKQLEIYHLKISGRRKEAAEKAAEYNRQAASVIPCMCGCGQRPVF